MEENQQPAGWWSDLVDNNPPSGSIDGNYATWQDEKLSERQNGTGKDVKH